MKLVLIDGNGILHRAFHALPPLKTSYGFPTNAIFGFFSMLNKIIKDFQPEYLAVAFDTPAPTFRKKIYKNYQAQRPKIKDEFKIQIPKVKEGLKLAGIFQIEKPGYEADDIIGSLSEKFKGKLNIFIVSGDKDILQLCSENIFILQPKTGITKLNIYTPEKVKKTLGVKPQNIPDLKALAGDQSDNYFGAKGIGPKTAIKLIQNFGSVENVFKNLDKIGKEKIKNILLNYKDDILTGKKLALIVKNLSLNINLEDLKFMGIKKDLKEFLKKFEMESLIKRFYNQNKDNKKENKKIQMNLF